jgi:hypothetical protein
VTIDLTPPLLKTKNYNINSLINNYTDIDNISVLDTININPDLFIDIYEKGFFYKINALIYKGLSLRESFNDWGELSLLKSIKKIFPYLFKDHFLSVNNNNMLEFIVKNIYHNLLINGKKNLLLMENNIKIGFKLKITFLNNEEVIGRKYTLIKKGNVRIDYNKIFLLIIDNKNNTHYLNLSAKLKKDNNISIKTENIINKHLLAYISKNIKDYISQYINIKNENIINTAALLKGLEKDLDSLNIIDILNEVIPDKMFFNTGFYPYIKYRKRDRAVEEN